MNAITPIRVLPEVELQAAAPKGRVDAWLRRVHEWVPFRIHYRVPYGRASVEARLRQRNDSALTEWSALGYPKDLVDRFLRTMQSAMNHPNHFLIPGDPLFLALTADYDDFPIETVRFGIKKQFGIDVPTQAFREMYDEGAWTVGGFASHVLSQLPPDRQNGNDA